MANRTRHSLAERLWSRVAKTDTCWLWDGPKQPRGYGKIGAGGAGGKTLLTHRVALEEAMRCAIPPGKMSLHTCDVPSCIRNDDVGVYIVNGVEFPRWGHLWLGTTDANAADMAAKQRAAMTVHPEAAAKGARNGAATHPERLARGDRSGSRLHPERLARGESHPSAKLTNANVIEIRRRHAAGEWQAVTAAAFGVRQGCISAIVLRKSWKHV